MYEMIFSELNDVGISLINKLPFRNYVCNVTFVNYVT